MDTTPTESPLPAEATVLRYASPRVESVEVEGETLVYDATTGCLHLLDPIGTVIWNLLDGTTTLGQTGQQLAGIFGRPTEEVLETVRHYATHLVANALAVRNG